ncbi:hypothetical protein EMCRGX_G000470 [Ephydatia muelleri]
MLQTSVGHANGNVAAAGAKLRHRQPAEQIEQISLVLLLCVPGGGIPASGPGYVYVLKMAHDDLKKVYIKIGRTANDVKERLADLQTGNPFKLNLWLTFSVEDMGKGESDAQTAVQNKKLMQKVKGGGTEWFTRNYEHTTFDTIEHAITEALPDGILDLHKDHRIADMCNIAKVNREAMREELVCAQEVTSKLNRAINANDKMAEQAGRDFQRECHIDHNPSF